MKGEGYVIDSPTSSSITTPSTGSSEEDLAAESEYGDGVVTWPWMQYIQENGDLLYVDSCYDELVRKDSTKEMSNGIATKGGGIQRKLRSVIKKSSSDIKQNSVKSSASNKSSNSIKSTSSLKNSLQEIFFQKSDKNGIQQSSASLKNEKVEQVSENMNLISRNVVLQLGNTVEKDFVNLENVFGIISGVDLNSIAEKDQGSSTYKRNLNAIVVQGIIPNSPAGRCTDIVIDDVVVAVNGIDINIKNIDTVLTQVNGVSEVVLKIERVTERCNDDTKSELCAIVSNDVWDGSEMFFRAFGEMCAIMYLTLNSNEEEPEGDILFWYPDSPLVEKLKDVRGIFLTLNDVMVNVSGTNVESSVLMIDGKVVNICYERFDSDVFVVAVPNEKCSMEKLQRKTCQCLQVLDVLYGEVAAAFSNNILLSMKHLIQKFADSLLEEEENVNIGVKQLQLSLQQYTEISTLLTDAESADYGECADDFFPHQRLYGTVGTCLFYKDALVCNHLPDKLVKIIVHICTFHWLFLLVKKEKLNQLIVWKELFLDKIIEDTDDGELMNDVKVRWFLLIVGQGRSMFCTVLQTGGVASIPDGNPGPHPFYVDTAWSILKYLLEVMEVEATCNTSLDVGSMPAIVTPLQALNPKTSQSPRALELTRRRVSSSNDAFSRINSFDPQVEHPALENTNSRGSSVSSSSSHAYLNEYNNFDRASNKSANTEHSTTTALSTKLTVGVPNALFCFTVLQPYSGIFISPNVLQLNDTFTNNIIVSFKSSCEAIHQMFQAEGEVARQIEHGILFHVESTQGAELKKGSPNVRYWVVGRLVRHGALEEEVYLCFEDGVPQNVIEMAYKMRFGCYY